MDTDIAGEDLEQLVPPLLGLCREAGAAICRYYEAPGADEFSAKADDSPLTQADLASDAILRRGLAGLALGLPVLSEESSPAELTGRQDWQRYWLVDPLDGTKEFLARTGEFTINIALIDRHVPVLGLLYQPLAATAYVGIPGHWARRYSDDKAGAWQVQALATRPAAPQRELTVLASRRHRGPQLQQCLDWLQGQGVQMRRENSGSALKFCQVAEGNGDFYPRFSPCCEWDTGAGQALVEAAGGCVIGLDGAPLRYNLHESLYSPKFYVMGDPQHALWQGLLAQEFTAS